MYLVRKTKKETFEVAKFEDYSQPTNVYVITKGKCNCPASWRSANCKHKKLLAEYEKDTSNIYYFDIDDKSEVFKGLILALN